MDAWLLQDEEELAELEPRDFRGAAAATAVNIIRNTEDLMAEPRNIRSWVLHQGRINRAQLGQNKKQTVSY